MCIFSKTTRLIDRFIHVHENNGDLDLDMSDNQNLSAEERLDKLIEFYNNHGISIPRNKREVKNTFAK